MKADTSFIARRLAEGASCSAIAKEVGLSRQRIYQLIDHHGLPRPIPRANELKAEKLAFQSQRNSARERGIAWELTFDQWLAIWLDSGKLEKRGRTKGCYVMARPGDVGPYAIGNVYITTHSDNAKTAQSHNVRRLAAPRKELTSRGGWAVRSGRRGYHGYFKTEEEADQKVADLLQAKDRAELLDLLAKYGHNAPITAQPKR